MKGLNSHQRSTADAARASFISIDSLLFYFIDGFPDRPGIFD